MFTCPLTVVTTNASNSSNVTANSTSGSYADQSAYHASLRRAEEGSPAAAASSFTGDGNGSFAVTSASASDGTVVSARVKARWLDYTRVSCVSPPRPAPSDGFRCVSFYSRVGNWTDVVFCCLILQRENAKRRLTRPRRRVAPVRRHRQQRRRYLRRLLRLRRVDRGHARCGRDSDAERGGSHVYVRDGETDRLVDIFVSPGPSRSVGGAGSTPRARAVRGGYHDHGPRGRVPTKWAPAV